MLIPTLDVLLGECDPGNVLLRCWGINPPQSLSGGHDSLLPRHARYPLLKLLLLLDLRLPLPVARAGLSIQRAISAAPGRPLEAKVVQLVAQLLLECGRRYRWERWDCRWSSGVLPTGGGRDELESWPPCRLDRR